MSSDKEVMRQALHALETKGEHHPRVYEAIDALRAALAQPEQLVVGGDDLPTLTKWTPQRKPLTEEHRDSIEHKAYLSTISKGKPMGDYAKILMSAIEKAHGIGGEV